MTASGDGIGEADDDDDIGDGDSVCLRAYALPTDCMLAICEGMGARSGEQARTVATARTGSVLNEVLVKLPFWHPERATSMNGLSLRDEPVLLAG